MSLGGAGKKRREQIKSLRSKRTVLLKQRDLSMNGRLLAAQNNVGSLGDPYERYYTSVATEVRVEGVPGSSLLILEKSTDKIVGEIEHGMFKNYGIPDAKWNGSELKIGGKVFIKSRGRNTKYDKLI